MMNSPSITLWSLAAASVAVMLLRLVWLRRTTRQGHAYQQRKAQREDAVMARAASSAKRGFDSLDGVANNADAVPLGNLTPEQEAQFLRNLNQIINGDDSRRDGAK